MPRKKDPCEAPAKSPPFLVMLSRASYHSSVMTTLRDETSPSRDPRAEPPTPKTWPALQIDPLPTLNLTHLLVLTDDTGILQHATYATPDLHHGYCTDDNARALIAAVNVLSLPREVWAQGDTVASDPDRLLIATQRYLAFLHYAFNDAAHRFRNFMQYDRSWLEEVGSEDSHARTIWGLGKAIRLAPSRDIRTLAERLMDRALPAVNEFHHLRPWAYALLGFDAYARARGTHPLAEAARAELAERLFAILQEHATDEWPWWEDWLTWGNAKLPHALLVGGHALHRDDMIHAALRALRWILDVQTGDHGQLSIIGNAGWYLRGNPERARFDQQPIEAKALVQACLTAAAVTRDPVWARQAERCFAWFTGGNDLGLPVYNAKTGGGQDGLTVHGVNANQGAESTLAYTLSVLALHNYERCRTGDLEGPPCPDF